MSDNTLAAWLVFINGLLFGSLVIVVKESIRVKDYDAVRYHSITQGIVIFIYLLVQMFVKGATP